MRKYSIILSAILIAIGALSPARAASSTVLITEVRLDDSQQFIELSNIHAQPLAITGWRLEYITASGLTTTTLATLQGGFKPSSSLLLAANAAISADGYFQKTLSKSGGHVRLVDADGQEVDRVGWGAAMVAEGKPAVTPADGQSLTRLANADTDDNFHDFTSGVPSPTTGGLLSNPESGCADLRINEILANPAGADTEGGEFIELYNAGSNAVTLSDCNLSTDKLNDYVFPASAQVLRGAYYVVELKGQLLNDGGFVRHGAAEPVIYPGLEDDYVWAWDGASWQISTQPTPGQPNLIKAIAAQQPESTIPPIPAKDEPCPAGKFRNPETNRCKNLEESTRATMTPCSPGQTRNPETNRCRLATATTATSQLVPCEPGYERNLATNRCRKISVQTSNELKPCPAGQSRNPETNRCRKDASESVVGSSGSSNSSGTGSAVSLGILVAAIVAAIGYGIYEYRTELRNWFAKLRQSRASSSTEQS